MTGQGATTACLLLALSATPAVAQVARPKVALGAGIGQADPLPLDLAFKAPSWFATIQFATGRHLTIEGTASGWRHVATSTFQADLTTRAGAALVHSRSDITEVTRQSTLNVSLVALATATFGRLTVSSGAGAGLSTVTAEITDTIVGCTSASPQSCQPYHSLATIPAIAAQCVLSADVTLTRRWRAFVTYRLSQPFSVPLGEISVAAGLKLTLGSLTGVGGGLQPAARPQG